MLVDFAAYCFCGIFYLTNLGQSEKGNFKIWYLLLILFVLLKSSSNIFSNEIIDYLMPLKIYLLNLVSEKLNKW